MGREKKKKKKQGEEEGEAGGGGFVVVVVGQSGHICFRIAVCVCCEMSYMCT